MVKTKENDFLEFDFTGKIKNNSKVFDTSKEDVAKKEDIFNPKMKYQPLVICLGQHQVIKGLEQELVNKELTKDYTIDIKSEDAYGKRESKLIRTIPKNTFTKNKVNPYPGMQVNADNMIGIVKSVSGGRVMVDFNHPLAGRDLIYEVKILKIVEDLNEKVKNLIGFTLFMREDMYKFNIKESKLMFETSHEVPDFLKKNFESKVKELIKEVKDVEFKKTEKKEEPKDKKEVATQS